MSEKTGVAKIRRRLRASWVPAAAIVFASLFWAAPSPAGVKLTSASTRVPRNTNPASGQELASATLALNTTLGEVGTASYSGGGFKVAAGYMALASQPGSVTSITAVTKATGTLQLSWVSPGFDGFQGSVVNGFYRLDYSSDPAHAFSPTVFQTEFSTSITPGASQYYTISGLLPNTTYYTKIYLADAGKFFAEDSTRSDQSTLANIPVNPFVSSVSSNSVTISWSLPAGGAEGYSDLASATNFGSVLASSATNSGAQLNLTISGLSPQTQFFFKVGSLNWQGDPDFTAVISAITSGGGPPGVSNLVAVSTAITRTVTLTWTNPNVNLRGLMVLLSTSAVTTAVVNGQNFVPGQVLGDNSIVKSTGVVSSLRDFGLPLDKTIFYHLFTQDSTLTYSVDVSTSIFLDLPPMQPAGFAVSVATDHSHITLNWSPVTTKTDGSPFVSTAAPLGVELSSYEIDRATSVLRANWVKITTLPATAVTFTDNIPVSTQTFIYRITSFDSLGLFDTSMAFDTDNNLYTFAPDQISRFRLAPNLIRELTAGGNSLGSDIFIRAVDEPSSVAQNIFRAVRFEPVESPSGKALSGFQFSKPGLDVSLRYETAGNQIVAAGTGPSPSNITASDAASRLGMYWNNGSKFVKLFGAVDPLNQTVTVHSEMLGEYQIRGLARAAGFSFDISTLSNKAITPNGDNLNDKAVFTFDNPNDSAFSGKIYDMRGATVADMAPGPLPNTLQWDGKADGRVVPGGVYIYQIKAEGKVFTGTLVVIR